MKESCEKPAELQLSSRNPLFPGILKNLALSFIFKNPRPLTEEQKEVVYEMAVTYFSPSPAVLSDVLLLSIIKIGPHCLQRYGQEILDKIEYYFQRVIIFKEQHLLEEEIEGLVTFLLEKLEKARREGATPTLKHWVWLLLLRPSNTFLHQLILTHASEDVLDMFRVFCILEPTRGGQGLSLLYLKCVNDLAPIFSKHHILEDVIRNFNKMKVPEPLYKPAKDLKLKLIRQADNSQALKKTWEEDKGFMGFLNEKMGKLKGRLDSSVSAKPRACVYYDQAAGEYRPANGAAKEGD